MILSVSRQRGTKRRDAQACTEHIPREKSNRHRILVPHLAIPREQPPSDFSYDTNQTECPAEKALLVSSRLTTHQKRSTTLPPLPARSKRSYAKRNNARTHALSWDACPPCEWTGEHLHLQSREQANESALQRPPCKQLGQLLSKISECNIDRSQRNTTLIAQQTRLLSRNEKRSPTRNSSPRM